MEVEQGRLAEATREFANAREMLEEVVIQIPEDARSQTGVAASYDRLGSVLLAQLELKEAERAFAEVATRMSIPIRREPDNRFHLRNLAVADFRLGEVYLAGVRGAIALRSHEVARVLARSNDKRRSTSQAAWQTVAQAHIEPAGMAFQKAMKRLQQLSERTPDDVILRQDLADTQMMMGIVMTVRDQRDEATRLFQEALEALSARIDKEPADDLAQFSYASAEIDRGRLLVLSGSLAEAEAAFSSCRTRAKNHLDQPSFSAKWQGVLAHAEDGLGDVLLGSGHLDAAASSYTQVLEFRKRVTGLRPTNSLERLDLAAALYKAGSAALMTSNRRQEAEEWLRGALAIVEDLQAQGRLPPAAGDWPELFARRLRGV